MNQLIDIIVKKGDGTHEGATITDVLLTSVSAALERGRNELNDSGLSEVNLTIKYLPGVKTGQIFRIIDDRQGIVWQGKLSQFTHRTIPNGAITDIVLKRLEL